MIVGFPGETEEEFGRTLAFAEECGFAAMHVFPYSIRPGTPAAEMEQVPAAVKEERAARAARTADKLRQAYLAGCVGEVYPVLLEQRRAGRWEGHAPNYIPVSLEGEGERNRVLDVRITGVEGDGLLGVSWPRQGA